MPKKGNINFRLTAGRTLSVKPLFTYAGIASPQLICVNVRLFDVMRRQISPAIS